MTLVKWGALSHSIIDDLFAAETGALDLGDRYQVHSILGQGGQGIVYLAHDMHIDREVAIKCAHGGSLHAEVALLKQLAHPGIPQVYDQAQAADGTHFMAMQYIDGERLDHYLEHLSTRSATTISLSSAATRQMTSALPVSLQKRLHLFRDICAAIHHAHTQGVLHRDIKPSNIMVTATGQVTIIDWGLAATGDVRSICGSPHFAAPEQLEGQPADKRADVFALGVLLYFIISGELPYARRATDFNEFRSIRAGLRRIPLGQVCSTAPAYLEGISMRAMSPQAAARYSDVQALIDDIDQHQYASGNRPHSARTLVLMLILIIAIAYVLDMNAHGGGGIRAVQDDQAAAEHPHPEPSHPQMPPAPTAAEPSVFIGPPLPDDFIWADETEEVLPTQTQDASDDQRTTDQADAQQPPAHTERIPSLENMFDL